MMSGVSITMTPEQEEILDSGLRMLAHMIAETHLRRIELREKNRGTTGSSEAAKPCKQIFQEIYSDKSISSGNNE